MELQDYFRIVRKRWRVIVATVLLVVALAAVYTMVAPRAYEARTELFVSTSGSSSDSLYQGSTFTQQRVKSYADVITTPKVLDPVIRQLDLQTSSTVLERQIKTTVPIDTVLIDVAVVDANPQRAADIANAVAVQFVNTVDELEGAGSGSGRDNPIAVSVVREAVSSGSPVSPKPVLNVIMGLVLGLVVGLLLALLREMLDTSVKSESDVRAITDEPVIGWIGYDPAAAKHPLISQNDTQGPRAEAFRALRTNLQFVDAAHEVRSIVLTSSVPGEGKTTMSANLALTMSEAGHRVCVIEADLRRPRLLDYLGLDGSVGLTNVLIGEAQLDDVLQPFGGTNALVLGAGPIPPNPSELLGSPNMRTVLDALEERFDYIFLDAPPLLPVTDAAVLARLCDGTILVAGSGVIRKEQLSKALAALERVQATVLGIVINRLPVKNAMSYSYYGDGYRSDPPAVERSRSAPSARRRPGRQALTWSAIRPKTSSPRR